MSRAFVNEDQGEPEHRYVLPPKEDPGYPMAAARTLIAGANQGNSIGAEDATGFRWGDPRLEAEVRQLLAEALEGDDDRLEILATRFLRAAGLEP